MLNNEQTIAKAIMEQEKNDRAPSMKEDDYFELFVTQLIMKNMNWMTMRLKMDLQMAGMTVDAMEYISL